MKLSDVKLTSTLPSRSRSSFLRFCTETGNFTLYVRMCFDLLAFVEMLILLIPHNILTLPNATRSLLRMNKVLVAVKLSRCS